ncbi:MAG: sigma-70 family RNA polymerase sigma factor [Clostridia bacterium]|nr:sigma-70 family RNA polymerase sigma factor [Clostridia bacterium]
MDNIYELILKVRNGDEIAFSEICKQYNSLLLSMSRKFCAMCQNASETEEDFLQEAKMALYKAISTFDVENQKVTFGAYSKVCIRNKLISCVRRIKSQKRQKCDSVTTMLSSSLQDEVISRELGEKISAIAEKKLSPYEMKIFSFMLRRMKAKEIALRINKSKKSVNNAIYRIRLKMKGTVI